MTGQEIVEFKSKEETPHTTSMFGERIMVPEFCGASCDRCDTSGYVHEEILLEADYFNKEVICKPCASWDELEPEEEVAERIGQAIEVITVGREDVCEVVTVEDLKQWRQTLMEE